MEEEKEQKPEPVREGEAGNSEPAYPAGRWQVGVGDSSPQINKSDIITSDIKNMEVHHHPIRLGALYKKYKGWSV